MTDTARTFRGGLESAFDAPPAGAGWGWILASGLVSVVFGILAFLWPFAATFAATLVIGAFFLASGLVSIGAGLFGKGHEGRGYLTGVGLVSLVIGLLMMLAPMTGAFSLTLLVAAWLVLRGAMEIGFGTRLRQGKGMLIALGLVNILLAVIVLATLPLSALTLPGFILGISFLSGGLTSIAAALHHRKGASAFTLG